MVNIKPSISNLHSPISSERRWVLAFALLVMLVTTIPYGIGYARQGTEWVFTGFVFGVEDGNSYLAKMLSGSAGAWNFRTPYTASPQNGILAFLPYLLLGKLAAPPGLHTQLAVLFHLFRFGSGILAILATYDFLAFFLRGNGLRRFGLALAVLGGGLGWIAVLLGKGSLLGSLPLEFYSPETFGFLSLYGIPHLALARAALLWGLLAYLKSGRAALTYETPSPIPAPSLSHQGKGKGVQFQPVSSGLKIGLFWLLTAIAQPLTALIFGGVIGLHLLVTVIRSSRRSGWRPQIGSKERWRLKNSTLLAFWAALLPAPFLLYNSLAFILDPFLKSWTAQNRILSPHPVHYLLAYGLLAPFAVKGARRLCKKRPWEGLFLTSWSCALPFLAYAPLNLQRRLPEGIWVAVVVLALAGFEGRKSSPMQTAQRSRLLPRSLYALLLAFPSTLLLLSGGILAALKPAQPVFQPAKEVEAFQFLQMSARSGEVVLSSYETGNALPAWAPVRSVIGHGPESVDLANLRPRVAAFYSTNTPDRDRIDLLRQFKVNYVFYGPHERSLGSWNPSESPFLQPIYSTPDYQILQVTITP